ncbi:MAG: hypothetical protein RI894_1709 [Bacteroidota bacterium]|jgi:hypothetical protein
MAFPSMFPLMRVAFLSSLKGCETVGCAKGSSFTISPQIQVSYLPARSNENLTRLGGNFVARKTHFYFGALPKSRTFVKLKKKC